MSLKNSRSADYRVNTLSCGDMYIIDTNCNGHFMNLDAIVISAQELKSSSDIIPLFISSNVTFAKDVAIQMDLIIEGNLIAGTSGTLNIIGNVDISDSLIVEKYLTVKKDAEIIGNLVIDNKLCVNNLLTAKDGIDIIGDLNVDGSLTVVQDITIDGNLFVLGETNFIGNTFMGNLQVYDLSVHNLYGFSPINFKSPVLTQSSITLSGVLNFLKTTFGAKIQLFDGGDAEVHGGNVRVTPIGASNGGGKVKIMDGGDCEVRGGNVMVTPVGALNGGGKVMIMDGGDCEVHGGNVMITPIGGNLGGGHLMVLDGGEVMVDGGNITVTGHTLTGKGSIEVLEEGTINLRGGDINVTQGGNVNITNNGSLVLDGGQLVVVMGGNVTSFDASVFSTSTTGDIVYTAAPMGTLATLPIGTAGQVMTVAGGLPAWTTSGAALLSIGTILQSMLTEVQFQTLNGVDWILMDGRSVLGSGYNVLTGFTNVPDARGIYLRGKNNGRVDGMENPAGDLALGTFENDQFQGHYHANDANADGGGEGFSGGGNIGNGLNVPTFAQTIITDGVNGTPRIGIETRVKSVTINYFIKID